MIHRDKITPARAEKRVRSYRSHQGVLLFLAILLSLASLLLFHRQGSVLGYKDVFSHLEIGRRILVGQATGFGQLGGVWLPLQHLLMLPLAWSEALYSTGLAGSIISMAAFVVCVLAVFRIVWLLTDSAWAAWVGAAVFGLNPDILFLQATPMTEVLMYMTILLAMLGLILWARTDHYRYLLLAACSTLALTLTRYEGWIMAAAFLGVVIYGCIRKGYRFFGDDQKAQGITIAFSSVAFLGVIGWLFWNHLIFDDWLNWMHGTYSARAQVSESDSLQVGNLQISILTFGWAAARTITLPILAAAVVGLVTLIWRERLSVESAVVLSSLIPAVFLVYGLFSGNQPMRVTEFDGNLFNVRFALVLLIPCSIAIGYLVGSITTRYSLRTAVSGLTGVSVLVYSAAIFLSGSSHSILTNREAHEAVAALGEQRRVSEWVRENTEGRVLIQAFENERAVFDIQSRVVYEGTPGWDEALIDPGAQEIDIVVMRHAPENPDSVHKHLNSSPAMANWLSVMETDSYQVYKRMEQQ